MGRVPEPIAQYAEIVRDYLGFQSWSLNIRAVSELSTPTELVDEEAGGVYATDARIEVKYDYLHADLLISEDLLDDYSDEMTIDELSVEIRVLLCHELIHLLDAPIEHAYEQAINLFVEETDDRRRAFYLVRSHVEHRVTRFAHQLFRLVEARRRIGLSDRELDGGIVAIGPVESGSDREAAE